MRVLAKEKERAGMVFLPHCQHVALLFTAWNPFVYVDSARCEAFAPWSQRRGVAAAHIETHSCHELRVLP